MGNQKKSTHTRTRVSKKDSQGNELSADQYILDCPFPPPDVLEAYKKTNPELVQLTIDLIRSEHDMALAERKASLERQNKDIENFAFGSKLGISLTIAIYLGVFILAFMGYDWKILAAIVSAPSAAIITSIFRK